VCVAVSDFVGHACCQHDIIDYDHSDERVHKLPLLQDVLHPGVEENSVSLRELLAQLVGTLSLIPISQVIKIRIKMHVTSRKMRG
jgi:hypothetical protein